MHLRGLLHDGKIVAAAEEERFLKVKASKCNEDAIASFDSGFIIELDLSSNQLDCLILAVL